MLVCGGGKNGRVQSIPLPLPVRQSGGMKVRRTDNQKIENEKKHDLQVKQRKLKNVKATTWIWLRWYMASTQSVNKQIMPRI